MDYDTLERLHLVHVTRAGLGGERHVDLVGVHRSAGRQEEDPAHRLIDGHDIGGLFSDAFLARHVGQVHELPAVHPDRARGHGRSPNDRHHQVRRASWNRCRVHQKSQGSGGP